MGVFCELFQALTNFIQPYEIIFTCDNRMQVVGLHVLVM